MAFEASSNGEEFNPLDYVPEGAEVLDVESEAVPVKNVQSSRRKFLGAMGAVIAGAALGGKSAESAEKSVSRGPVTPENDTPADAAYRKVIQNPGQWAENIASNPNASRTRDADWAFYSRVKPEDREFAEGFEGANGEHGQTVYKFRVKYRGKDKIEKYTPWYHVSTHPNLAHNKHNPRGIGYSVELGDDPKIASAD